jgi:hypothetical protein
MDIIPFVRMHRNFGRRRFKYQPSVAGINVRQVKHIPQEHTVGLRVGAENNRVCANDHAIYPFRKGGCHGVPQLAPVAAPTFTTVIVL